MPNSLFAFMLILFACLAGCSTVGHDFRSDPGTLSRLVVGQTTPDEAAGILGGEPFVRQSKEDGTVVWHWRRIAASLFGTADNRLLSLQFTSSDGGESWRFKTILKAQNIDLPPGLPWGVKSQ